MHAMQVTPEDIDPALRDNLEHYMDSAADPDFAEACCQSLLPMPSDIHHLTAMCIKWSHPLPFMALLTNTAGIREHY